MQDSEALYVVSAAYKLFIIKAKSADEGQAQNQLFNLMNTNPV